MAERLGVNLKMHPLRERGSAALHGFYVGASPEGLRKALIFLNTAHHPLAVATAFCHEVGHHLASGMFNHRAAGIELMMNGEFSEHLSNPVELAADIVVSLAAYPAPVARRLFASKCRAGGTQQRDPLTIPVLAGVENHLNRSYRYAHASGRPVMWSDHYAAGILHYAALRWALLSERDI
jgi:hypothetical protein